MYKVKGFIIWVLVLCGFASQGFGQLDSTSTDTNHVGGLIFEDDDLYEALDQASVPMMGSLPEMVDLSKWFPKPGHQGQQASCVGWAVGYGLKSYQEAVERGRRAQNQNEVYSPSYIYNQIQRFGCSKGSQISDALELLKNEGVASMAMFPYSAYSCGNKPGSDVKNGAKNFKIADYRRLNASDDIEVKSQLNKGFPIVIGMYYDRSFEKLGYNQVYKGMIGKGRGGHAMVVVGYDDAKGAYKVFNSWGTNWGTNGYGWVSYGAFARLVKRAFTAQDEVSTNSTSSTPTDVSVPRPIAHTENLNILLQTPQVLHNQFVIMNGVRVPTMKIMLPGQINNGNGAYGQVVVRFYLSNGQPLIANAREGYYKDAHGLAAIGSIRAPINSNSFPISPVMEIPYYALNFVNTGGRTRYDVFMQATVYINDYERAKSDFVPMTIFF
ncbi:MAG: C1 family peptidase [Bacteroidia bacterium]